MKFISPALLLVLLGFAVQSAAGDTLDTIGVTLLRTVTTNLNGSGICVAQAEANTGSTPPAFEVDPAAVGQSPDLFAYYSTNGSSLIFSDFVGVESSHATGVGGIFYGLSGGVATNVAHVDNYDADYFVNDIIFRALPPSILGRIANQSFIFSDSTTAEQVTIDKYYDDYAAQYGTLFVSGIGNGGAVNPPGTCYNGIGVGVIDGGSSVGPTPENGRCKPDLTAPGGYTSASAPYVSGAAAVLLQAGLRGDGGGDTAAAADLRTLKALLLNGAIKPANWTNAANFPLDARYGTGVLNVFNSYKQLTGGKHTSITSGTVLLGKPHPPTGATGTVEAFSGWDFASLSSTTGSDRINHYYFNVTNGISNATFTATITLVWNRLENQADINDLDLQLYDTANSNLVAESISFVNNVEHLHVIDLPPARYDLQVWKAGGYTANGRITASETYALAFEFFALPLCLVLGDTNAVLTWPIYPTGFTLESAPDLAPVANWSAVGVTPTIINNENRVSLNIGSGNQFFQLKRP